MDNENIPINSVTLSSPKPAGRVIKLILGYLVAAVCLVWVFHDIHFHRLLEDMRAINWWLVALGMVFDVLSYICGGIRWSFLLKPLGNISVLRTTQAIYAGLFMNEVLPMRVGELARAYLVSRWISKEFISVIPSMALERLFEGVWLAIGIGVAAIFVPLPRNLLEAGDILRIVVLVAAGFFIYLVFWRKRESGKKSPKKASRFKIIRLLRSVFERLGTGFHDIGMSRAFYFAFIASLFLFIFQALSFWSIMWAYGLRLSFWIGAAVFLIVHLGTAIPNAPANIGSYQFFCVIGLTLFGIDKTLATGFSMVVFILLTLPLWAIGFFALGQSGMTLSSIKSRLKNVKIR